MKKWLKISIYLAILLVAIATITLWHRPNVLIDVIAIIAAVFGLIAVGIGYKKKTTNGSTVGVSLVVATILLLVLSIYYDTKKGTPTGIEKLEIGAGGLQIFFSRIERGAVKTCVNKVCSAPDNTCNENNCESCIGPTFLSRDWYKAECNALSNVKDRLNLIRLKSLEESPQTVFLDFEIFRKEIIRKIELATAALNLPDERLSQLKEAVAEMIVLDQLIFNAVEATYTES